MKSQSKLLLLKLEGQMGRNRESQLTGAETHGQKPPGEPVGVWKTWTVIDEFLETQCQWLWELKTSWRSSVCRIPTLLGVLSSEALPDSHNEYQKKKKNPSHLAGWKEKVKFWNMLQNSVLNKSCPLEKLSYQKLTFGVFSSVQSLSRVQLFATPWTAAHQASLSITNSQSLLKLMSTASVMPPNHLIFCHPLLLPPSILPSIRVFSNESILCIRWPKYWSFSFSISPSNEYSGRISFRMNWLDNLAVQGTLKSLLQHHSSKASILWSSAFFRVQLSHAYMTTGKTIALTRWTFVGKVISLVLIRCLGWS